MPQTPGAALLRRRWADPDVPDDQMLPAAEAMGLGKAAHRAVGAFVRAMRELEDIMDVSTPGELVREVVDKVGFEAYVSDQENGDERWGFVRSSSPSPATGTRSRRPSEFQTTFQATIPATRSPTRSPRTARSLWSALTPCTRFWRVSRS